MDKSLRWLAFSKDELEAIALHLSFTNSISSRLAPGLSSEIKEILYPKPPTPAERAKKLTEVWRSAYGRISLPEWEKMIAEEIQAALDEDRKVRDVK